MDYHSRMTSLGTKRAVRPYWRLYHQGKAKGLVCPYHDHCLATRGDRGAVSKRELYVNCCPLCNDREGPYRAYVKDSPLPNAWRRGVHSWEGFIRYTKARAERDVRNRMSRDIAILARTDREKYEALDREALRKKYMLEELRWFFRLLKEDALFQKYKHEHPVKEAQ